MKHSENYFKNQILINHFQKLISVAEDTEAMEEERLSFIEGYLIALKSVFETENNCEDKQLSETIKIIGG